MARAVPRAVRGAVAYARAAHAAPTAVVTVLATGLAAGAGAPPATTALVAAAVLTGQLSVGWCNDAVDAARDVATGRADKPVVRGEVSPAGLRRAALVALGACAVLSWALGPLPGTLHLVAVGSAWAYDLRLKATALSWLPYAVSFGLLAAAVVTALPGRPLPRPWVVVAAALLGVGAHLANAAPDLEDDERTGVRGLPHRLGRRLTATLTPVVLLVAAVVAVAGSGALAGRPLLAVSAGGVAVGLASAAGSVAVRRPSSRAPFALAMGFAAVCVTVLVAGGRAVLA